MKKQKIYLTGGVTRRDTAQIGEFDLVKEKLEKAGFVVTTCVEAMGTDITIYVKKDLSANDFRDIMRKRWQALLESDQVVYLKDWESEHGSLNEVRFSKEVYIPQYEAEKFIEEYCSNVPA